LTEFLGSNVKLLLLCCYFFNQLFNSNTDRDLSQFRFDILFLESGDTDIFNVLFVGQQRSLQDVFETKSGSFQIESEPGDGLNLLPMAILHGLVAHQLEQGTDVVEVVDGLLQRVEGRPLLQGLGQLSATILELEEFVVDVLDVDLGPGDVVVVVDAVDDVVVKLVETLQQIQLLLDLVQLRLWTINNI
jgi:hypothetical protein